MGGVQLEDLKFNKIDGHSVITEDNSILPEGLTRESAKKLELAISQRLKAKIGVSFLRLVLFSFLGILLFHATTYLGFNPQLKVLIVSFIL